MNKYFILLFFCSVFSLESIISQTPEIKWWFDTKSFCAGQSAAADIDGDGKYEIVFGCYRNDGGIYALNAEDGTLLWKYFPHNPPNEGCNDAAPTIYDIDSDGNKEVIVASSCTDKTICLDGKTGVLKWSAISRGSDSPPTIADLDGDGKPEILHGEFGGWVRCLNGEDGTLAWDLSVDMDSWIQTAPTIVDLNSDGQLDFVVGTWNFNKKDSIYAFEGKSRNKLWTVPVHNWMYHGTAIADFDEDGNPELLIGTYNDTLYCINGENGTTDWKYGAEGSAIACPASIGDVDNDGDCDVIFTSYYKVICLNNKGKLKWKYNLPDYSYNFRGVVLSDINNDEFIDVILGSYSGNFIVLNGKNGNLITKINLLEHYGKSIFDINHAPLVADFDFDGNLDAFVVGGYGVSSPTIENNYGRAYMLGIGKGNGPEWLMFQHDIRRQSSLCYSYENSNSIYSNQVSENIDIFPNPAKHEIALNIEFDMVVIYDIFGHLVKSQTCYTDQKIDISDLRSGLYLLISLKNNHQTGSSKFIIHK